MRVVNFAQSLDVRLPNATLLRSESGGHGELGVQAIRDEPFAVTHNRALAIGEFR